MANTSGLSKTPLVLGAALSVPSTTELQALAIDGMTIGTEVFVIADDQRWTLLVSTATLGADVLAVSGVTGMRWISRGSETGFVTFADLADTTLNDAGANLIGVYANGGMFSEPTLQGVLEEDVVLKAILAATDNTGGAQLVGIQDVGAYFTGTEVEAALQELGAAFAGLTSKQNIANPSNFTLSSGNSLTATLADAGTNTAPVSRGITHTTSGTAAAGFGVLDFVDLESGGGTTRRVMTDVTTLTTATDAAEVAKRVIQLMTAGALVDALDIRPNQTLFKNGTQALPGVAVGSTDYGFRQASSQLHAILAGAIALYVAADGITIGQGSNGYVALASGDDCTLRAQTTGGGARKIVLDGTGGVVAGPSGALATNATTGFFYIPTCAGTPTGVPDTATGKVPMIYDTTNNKFYIYNGGWKGGTVPGVFV